MRYQKFLTGLFAVIVVQFLCGNSFGATITGLIKYDGEVPKFKEIKMDADPICLAKHTDSVYPDTLVVGDGNAMANVFVQVKSGLKQTVYPAPKDPVVLDQAGCHYKPHVFAVMVGQELKILNSDGTLHNVHILAKVNAEANMAMPQFRKEATKVFDKAEPMFPIKCDVHPWMESWCAIMAHPFFAVSGADGKFSISGLEAGTYEIEAWHEKLGTQTVSVTVGADETKEANFTFSRPAK